MNAAVAKKKGEDPEVEWITLTPQLAEQFLEHNEGNRNPKAGAQALYVDDMERGEWLVTGEPIQFDKDGRMIDGQNRCLAVINSRKPIRVLVVRGLDPKVQTVIDTGARRTAADGLRFAGHGKYPSIVGSVARYHTSYMSGKLTTTDSRAVSMSNRAIIAWAEENPDVGYAIEQAKGLPKIIGLGPSVLAFAILLTHRKNPEASDVFWASLSQQATQGEGDPRSHLLRALATNAMLHSSLRSRATVQLSLVLKAWNDWRKGEKVTGYRSPTEGGRAHRLIQWNEIAD